MPRRALRLPEWRRNRTGAPLDDLPDGNLGNGLSPALAPVELSFGE